MAVLVRSLTADCSSGSVLRRRLPSTEGGTTGRVRASRSGSSLRQQGEPLTFRSKTPAYEPCASRTLRLGRETRSSACLCCVLGMSSTAHLFELKEGPERGRRHRRGRRRWPEGTPPPHRPPRHISHWALSSTELNKNAISSSSRCMSALNRGHSPADNRTYDLVPELIRSIRADSSLLLRTFCLDALDAEA